MWSSAQRHQEAESRITSGTLCFRAYVPMWCEQHFDTCRRRCRWRGKDVWMPKVEKNFLFMKKKKMPCHCVCNIVFAHVSAWRVLILLHFVSTYYYICVLVLLHMCSHTTTYVSSGLYLLSMHHHTITYTVCPDTPIYVCIFGVHGRVVSDFWENEF
jgi:hypothetical protein